MGGCSWRSRRSLPNNRAAAVIKMNNMFDSRQGIIVWLFTIQANSGDNRIVTHVNDGKGAMVVRLAGFEAKTGVSPIVQEE